MNYQTIWDYLDAQRMDVLRTFLYYIVMCLAKIKSGPL